MLSYHQPLGESTQMSLSVAVDYGTRDYTSLGWYGAMTPRPDNYRYLPSYYGSVGIASEIEKALPDSTLFELKTYPELALETINGNIVGFVVDSAVGLAMIASSEGALEVSSFAFTAEEASFGKAVVIAKGNEDLVAAINEVIAKVTEDGSYQAAYDEAVAATSAEEEAAE